MQRDKMILKDEHGRDEAYVFDMDGVLACNLHRLHLLQCRYPDYNEYDALSVHDPVLPHCETLRILSVSFRIVILSSRNRFIRTATERWLLLNDVPWDEIHLRDSRKFSGPTFHDYKPAIVKELNKKYHIQRIFDDHPGTIAKYKELFPDIPVTLVPSGYYDNGEVEWKD